MGRPHQPTQESVSPRYWFVLEQVDEDGGRPYLSQYDLDQWGGVPIPIHSDTAFHPAYEHPQVRRFDQEAKVTLAYADIAAAAQAAGRNLEYPLVLSTITLPQRLGRVVFNTWSRAELGARGGFIQLEDIDTPEKPAEHED